MGPEEFKRKIIPLQNELYRYALWKVGNRPEAEDIVQEGYLRLWKMRSRLGEYNRVEALAIKIIRNLCVDQARAKKKGPGQLLKIGLRPNEKSPESYYIEKENVMVIERIFQSLPEPYQTVLFLRSIERYSIKEIAEKLEMKINTVEVVLSRARKKIKSQLKMIRNHE